MKINFTILIAVILIISILIIPINVWVFSISDLVITNGTHLKKSDWLSFVGSFLSYLGTIILGALALWQNRKLSEINEKLVNLNTTAEFYPEIKPVYLEIEKNKIASPLGVLMGNIAQCLVRDQNSNKKESVELWHIRLSFEKTRPFTPNLYNIERCEIYLDNIDGETQKSIIGYCAPKDKHAYFMMPNKTNDKLKDSVITSIYFTLKENDEKIWKMFLRAKKLNMNLYFKYKNSFEIEAKSSIKINWSGSKNETRYKNFKTSDYYIYETKIN